MKKTIYFLAFCASLFVFSNCTSPEGGASQDASSEETTTESVTNDQPKAPKGNPAEKMIKRYDDMVSLNEEQKAAIQTLFAEYNMDGVDQDGRKKMQMEIRDRINKEVLTEEQQASMGNK